MAKTYELEGVMKVIGDVQTFASGFTKREFVVETTEDRFPQSVKFECVKEKTALTDGFALGDSVTVSFDIRGNEYNGKYYVNLNAWRLEKEGGAPNSAAAGDEMGDPPPGHLSEPPAGHGNDLDDDIPF